MYLHKLLKGILKIKVIIANIISACLRPKPRATNTFKNVLIVPFKALTLLPLEVNSWAHTSPGPE
jgi:hypothetical protein